MITTSYLLLGLSILRVIGNYKYIFYDKYLAQLQLHISNSRVYLKIKKKKKKILILEIKNQGKVIAVCRECF